VSLFAVVNTRKADCQKAQIHATAKDIPPYYNDFTKIEYSCKVFSFKITANVHAVIEGD
jgi:hypothetical protein